MSLLDGTKCTAGYMHEGMFLPGVGDIRKELVVNGPPSTQSVKSIVVQTPFAVVTITDKKSNREYVLPVPLTNFKFLVAGSERIQASPLRVTE